MKKSFDIENIPEVLALFHTIEKAYENPGIHHFVKVNGKSYLFWTVKSIRVHIEVEGDIEDLSESPPSKEGGE